MRISDSSDYGGGLQPQGQTGARPPSWLPEWIERESSADICGRRPGRCFGFPALGVGEVARPEYPWDTAGMYSAQVLDHFKNPRNAGELPNATATVEVTNPVCGDIMQLAVRVESKRIAEARFKTRGCVTAIACGSLLTELIHGRTLDEARGITYEQISEALGGLPPATVHGSQLACDALEAVLAKLT